MFILLLMVFGSGMGQTGRTLQPEIGVSPLWVAGEYGLYWGFTLTGGIEFMKHHKVLLSADLAPLGILGMDDVDTEGKEQHWGGTLCYILQIPIINNLLSIEPGAMVGVSSIPYVYGTFQRLTIDANPSTPTPKRRPERETIWGLGPELRISIGRNSVRFYMQGRALFAKDYNFALLTNAGVAFKL